LSQFVPEFVHRCDFSQPSLPCLVVKVYGLHGAVVLRHVLQCRWVYDRRLFAFESFVCDGCRMFDDLRFGTPHWLILWWHFVLLLHDLPPSILTSAPGHFIGGDLDKALTIRIGFPVARREDFEMIDWLYAMIVLVVVDLSVDLMLDNLVFVWFHDFVCDGYIVLVDMFRKHKSLDCSKNIPGAHRTSLSSSTVFLRSTTPSRSRTISRPMSSCPFSAVLASRGAL
jgi:hypothetical protein